MRMKTMENENMRSFVKTAAVAGVAGVLAIASMTPSEARNRGWGVAAGIGLAGAAIASAAAANSYYYGPGYYGYYGADYGYAPGYAYEPYYAAPGYSYGYAPGYSAYAYAPGYSGYGYVNRFGSYPPNYDPGYGYNSNTTSPAHERQLQGRDY
jgi:hypothetical protein